MDVTMGGGAANVIDVARYVPQARRDRDVFIPLPLPLGLTRQLYMDALVFILSSPASFHRNRAPKYQNKALARTAEE